MEEGLRGDGIGQSHEVWTLEKMFLTWDMDRC